MCRTSGPNLKHRATMTRRDTEARFRAFPMKYRFIIDADIVIVRAHSRRVQSSPDLNDGGKTIEPMQP